MAVIDLPVCPNCYEAGVALGLAPGLIYDRATDKTGNCPVCWAEKVSLLAREKAGIRRDYWDATFDIFEPRQEFPNQQQVLDFCRLYAEQWPTVKGEGRCLTILGTNSGMGKSHLAVSICLELIKKHWTRSVSDQDVCLFVNVTNWFLDWANFYRRFPPPPSRSPLWADLLENHEYVQQKDFLTRRDARMFATELLVLDDLTAFDSADRASRLERLYNLIDNRQSEGRPIVVTDNLSKWSAISAKLGDEYGPRIVDRLNRNGDTIVIEKLLSKKGRKKSS